MFNSHKFWFRRGLAIVFLISLTLNLGLANISANGFHLALVKRAIATSSHPRELVQQGVELYQTGNFLGAIDRWESALNIYQNSNNRPHGAIVWENLARAYQQIGKIDRAIESRSKAIDYYRQEKDLARVGRISIEQAQAYTHLGIYKRSLTLLCSPSEEDSECLAGSALEIARSTGDRLAEAAAEGSLGDVYRLKGSYDRAIKALENSLKIALEIDNKSYQSSALNSLGSVYVGLAQVNYRRARGAAEIGDIHDAARFQQSGRNYDNKARKYFQQSLDISSSLNNRSAQLKTLLNLIRLYYRIKKLNLAEDTFKEALPLLKSLPDSRNKVYATIDLANLLPPVISVEDISSPTHCQKPEVDERAEELLNQAIATASSLEDFRALSFGLGELGHLYECRQNYDRALNLTRRALRAADKNFYAKDSLYLWEWQTGRILKAQNHNKEAIAAYDRAVKTLEKIRSDILISSRDLQFDFRDRVAPVYRELAKLKLDRFSVPSISPITRTSEVNSALITIDSLRLAELENYFDNNCVSEEIDSKNVTQVRENYTAIFNLVIFADRTAILLTLPNGERKLGWIDIDRDRLREEINEFRRGLERFRDFVYNPQQAQKLYNWIIRPFEEQLRQNKIKTLVFVPDGILRSVPMAALHDGKQFLIQKYAIATTPSLSVTVARSPDPKNIKALALGLTKVARVEGRTFPALNNVRSEIEAIENQFPSSTVLLNEDFTRDRLERELTQTVYPIIHIATHGEFSTLPEDTFLVTGNQQKLTISQLDDLIRNISGGSRSVELLALTACETAVGDERAALGLAGVGVRAGVRSTLASLWSIQDAPTASLVSKFYARLSQTNTTKAESLQFAQKAAIEAGGRYAHPAYWAPFILIGNWR
ncbi:MAG: CHAT domain-containing protein [Prochloraceae cyanobacterium]|nr:CHAT domain-containing protein [Prochloraceae cyanobacterium]